MRGLTASGRVSRRRRMENCGSYPWMGSASLIQRRLAFNKLPPPVHIEQVIADGKTYWQNWSGEAYSPHPTLPPHVRNFAIDYTALSLVAPEKVRFRFKLEGQDKDWREVVNVRQVQYSNLAPGQLPLQGHRLQ